MSIIKVKTGGITADAITDALIADDVVGTEHLTANEVDTTALGADAVTGAQLADDAVNSEHYTDGSVDTAHIADAQITTAKLSTAVFTGATDIGADLADADLILVDDGAGGTIRKAALSRIKTYNPGFSTLGASSVYLTGDLAISGSGYLTQSGAGAALGIYNATASNSGIVTSTTDGHITLDKTGFYLIIYQMNANCSSGSDVFNSYIRTWNGSAESNIGYSYLAPNNNDDDTVEGTCVAILDVDNVSNIKFHMGYAGAANITLRGTGQSVTSMHFIRLGDT
jgi:hypothetical protein